MSKGRKSREEKGAPGKSSGDMLPEKSQASRPSPRRGAAVARTTSWSGPLPPPEHLQAYNDILPGGAERIFALTESQTSHRQEIEKQIINSRTANMKRGQWFAFFVALAFLGGALYCAKLGHPTLAGIIAGSTLVSLVSAFLYSVSSQKQERRERGNQ